MLLVGCLTMLMPLFVFSQNAAGHRLSWFPKADSSRHFQRFYFYWGYNRATFARSYIHFSGLEYDFTLFNVEAKDRPTKFSFKTYFGPTTISIPQYNYRLGFFLTRHFAISGGVDHLKYVVVQDQTVRMSGVISEDVSARYAGSYLLRPIQLTTDFVRFEHTDGLNLANLDLEYHATVLEWKRPYLALYVVAGLGGI